MKKNSLSLISLIIASLLLGGIGILAKSISIPSLSLVAFRSLIAAVFLWLFVAIRKSALKVENFRILLICSIILALHWITLVQAYKIADVAPVAIALFTFPTFTAVAEPLFFREKLQVRQVLLGIFVIAGVIFLIQNQKGSNTDNTLGIILALISSLLFTARNLMTRTIMKKVDAINLMAWQTLIAAVILLPFVPLEIKILPDFSDVLLTLLLGVGFTAIPHTIITFSIARVSATSTGIVMSLQVAAAALWAWFFLNETVTVYTVVGAGIIVAAVIIEAFFQKR